MRAFILCFLIVVTSPASAQHPLNEGFELRSRNDSSQAWGWWSRSVRPNGSYEMRRDSVTRHEGRYSLRLRATSAAAGEIRVGTELGCVRGTCRSFGVTGWVRADSGTAAIVVKLSRDTLLLASDSAAVSDSGTGWHRVRATVRIAAGANSADVALVHTGPGSAWFDDLAFFQNGQRLRVRPPSGGDYHDADARTREWIAANGTPVRAIDPGGSGSDLQHWRELTRSARLVGLGEQTHGTSEFFRLKHRLIRDGVENGGVTLIGFEDNPVPVAEVNRFVHGAAGDVDSLLRTFFRTWQTTEVRSFLLWLRAANAERAASGRTPVDLFGFDMQEAGKPAAAVLEYVRATDPAHASRVDSLYRGIIAAWRRERYPNLPDSTLHQYEADARAVLTYLDSARVERRSHGTDSVELDDARDLALVVTQGVHDHLETSNAFRDSTMAEHMLRALARRPSGTRAMLWAHNMHVSYDSGWMGDHLRRRLGSAYVSLGFATAAGTYRARLLDPVTGAPRPWTDSLVLTPAATGSAEFTLGRLASRVGGVAQLYDVRRIVADPRGAWLAQPREFNDIGANVADFGISVMNPGRLFDLLLFVPRTTTAHGLPARSEPTTR